MATRLEVAARREALYQALRRSCGDGTWAPGALLPTVRELGERHGVSANVVFGVIKTLTDEGVLYTVPRVGAFVGKPRPQTVEPFLVVVPYRDAEMGSFWWQAQTGFEDRIAQLGGHSIVLSEEEASDYLERDAAPRLAGIFESQQAVKSLETGAIARVRFGAPTSDSRADCIRFDDVAGGAQATRHLRENGHQRIAFLGLHHLGESGEFIWSAWREQGWRQAAPVASDQLLFLPPQTSGVGGAQQRTSAQQTAQSLVGCDDITAVVAVNIHAARGMFEAFRAANWDAAKWPAVVCFDEAPGARNSVVSYLRLPWEEIGREAAQVLWERRNGRLSGAPIQRLVPMRMIARLSCRADWGAAHRHVGAEPFYPRNPQLREVSAV